MRFNKFLLIVASVLCCSSAAMADTVFMIQLGSYDSESEANSYWENLSSDNEKLLSNLTPLNLSLIHI